MLRDLGVERPELLGTLFLAGPDDLAELAGATPPARRRLAEAARRPGRERRARRGALEGWLDPTVQRERFARSALVARLFPRRGARRDARRRSSAAASSTTRSRPPTRGSAARPPRSRTRTARSPRPTCARSRSGASAATSTCERPIRRARAEGKGGPLVELRARRRGAGRSRLVRRRARLPPRVVGEPGSERAPLLALRALHGRAHGGGRAAAERHGVRAGKEPDDRRCGASSPSTSPRSARPGPVAARGRGHSGSARGGAR